MKDTGPRHDHTFSIEIFNEYRVASREDPRGAGSVPFPVGSRLTNLSCIHWNTITAINFSIPPFHLYSRAATARPVIQCTRNERSWDAVLISIREPKCQYFAVERSERPAPVISPANWLPSVLSVQPMTAQTEISESLFHSSWMRKMLP